MRWLKGVGFLLLFIAVGIGCEKDDKRNQEIQKEIQEKTQKSRQFYEGVQKGVDNLEKSVQEQQQGDKK